MIKSAECIPDRFVGPLCILELKPKMFRSKVVDARAIQQRRFVLGLGR